MQKMVHQDTVEEGKREGGERQEGWREGRKNKIKVGKLKTHLTKVSSNNIQGKKKNSSFLNFSSNLLTEKLLVQNSKRAGKSAEEEKGVYFVT